MNRSTIPYSIVEERRRLNKCIENAPNEWEREIYKKIRDMKIPYDKLDTILETSKELIEAYAKVMELDAACILAGNGSDEMLGFLIQ